MRGRVWELYTKCRWCGLRLLPDSFCSSARRETVWRPLQLWEGSWDMGCAVWALIFRHLPQHCLGHVGKKWTAGSIGAPRNCQVSPFVILVAPTRPQGKGATTAPETCHFIIQANTHFTGGAIGVLLNYPEPALGILKRSKSSSKEWSKVGFPFRKRVLGTTGWGGFPRSLTHLLEKALDSVSSKQPWGLRVGYNTRAGPEPQTEWQHIQIMPSWATVRVHTNY